MQGKLELPLAPPSRAWAILAIIGMFSRIAVLLVCPLLNLVKPYSVLQSLYSVSQDPDRESNPDWVRRWPKLFPIWWMAYLASMIATNIFFRSSNDNFTHPLTWLGIAAVTCGLVAATCATAIVWTIQRNQEGLVAAAIRERTGEQRQFQPPSS